MPNPFNKNKNPKPVRSNRTGEDIDMLNESRTDPQSSDGSGSSSYKDDIDGA